MAFIPKYTLTPRILRSLSRIEAVRHHITGLPVTAALVASLRESALLATTHYSTAIEGNCLTSIEVKGIIRQGCHFPDRQKDEKEVRNYYQALEFMEALTSKKMPVQEKDVKTLHGLSFMGKRKPTPWRTEQNVIRKGRLVVYIPPKAEDVSILMKELVTWITDAWKRNIAVPVIAGLAHYQFATIHPYYDGNGRTARLLTTLILHKYDYHLKGIYSLEEYYANNLQQYYDALRVGNDEDYYEGKREEADLTGFLQYFIEGMAESFDKVRIQALNSQLNDQPDQTSVLRSLSPQQRQVLKLFIASTEVTARDVGLFFQYSDPQARRLCQKWLNTGFFEIADASYRNRRYKLERLYDQLIKTQSVIY